MEGVAKIPHFRGLNETKMSIGVTDLLMCVGPADVDRLFGLALKCALQNLEADGSIKIVSPVPRRVTQAITGIDLGGRDLVVLADEEVLPPCEAGLTGWLRQQLIKLRADQICGSEHVWCLSADTLIVKPVRKLDVSEAGTPVIFYNRYPFTNNHLEYERSRVMAVASLLGVEPHSSYLLGDFIVDLALLECEYLTRLRSWIERRFGRRGLSDVIPGAAETLNEKKAFGEWTLYAVFVLDALEANTPVRNSNSRHAAQVHSRHDLADDALFEASIIHFVPKEIPVEEFQAVLAKHNLMRPCR